MSRIGAKINEANTPVPAATAYLCREELQGQKRLKYGQLCNGRRLVFIIHLLTTFSEMKSKVNTLVCFFIV